MPLQDLICGMANWDIFLAAVQKDSTLEQDLLSFVAQPWVDRPWFRLNTHPAMAALFNDPSQAGALQDLKEIVGSIDRSLTPKQSKWFVPYLRDVSVADVIYTSMTKLTSVVFDNDGVDALERVADAAVTPQRIARALKAMRAAMAAPVPQAVADAAPAGGSPVVSGAFAGFQAYWSKQRRAKYLDVYDAVQTDNHYKRVAHFYHELIPFVNSQRLEGLLSALDSSLPQDRLDRLAAALGSLLGGTWGLGVAERMDDALPKSRLLALLLAADEAFTDERIALVPQVLDATSEAFTPARAARAFAVLDRLLSKERLAGYGAVISGAVADPERLERYMAAIERSLDATAVGRLLDAAGDLMVRPGQLEAVMRVMDAAWGDEGQLDAWLDAVDTINVGRNGRGTKLLAIADLAATPKTGSPTAGGLSNLLGALRLASSGPHVGALLDDPARLTKALAALPPVINLLDALLPAGAALRLLRALDSTLGEEWARAEVEIMAEAASNGAEAGGQQPVLWAGAGRIMWAAHGAMFRELLGAAA